MKLDNFMIEEEYCYKNLSYYNPKEVIPLVLLRYKIKTIVKFKALLDDEDMVNIYIQKNGENSDTLFDKVSIIKFRDTYQIV